MRPTILRALALTAVLLAPTAALAQSEPEQPYDGPRMMWGEDDGSWGPGMMGRGGGAGMMGGCPMMGAMMRGPMMGGSMMGGEDFQRSASAWLDGQLAYTHTELGITEAQEPLWKAYVDSVHDRSAGMLAMHQAMWSARRQQQGVPFNEAYDLHIKLMEARLDAMKASRDTSLKLYNALTPEQQKKASWILPQSMCMM